MYITNKYRGDHLKGSIVNCPKCSRLFLDKSLLDYHCSNVHCSNGDYTCPFKSEKFINVLLLLIVLLELDFWCNTFTFIHNFSAFNVLTLLCKYLCFVKSFNP